LDHLFGPGLLVLVHNELEFAQMVGVAKGVLAVIEAEVGLPMIVHRSPLKGGQDTHSSHTFLPTFGMDTVVGEQLSAGDVQPIQLAFNPKAALVKVNHGRGNELSLGRLQAGLNLIHHRRIGVQDQGFRRSVSVEVSQQLTSACQRYELVVVQVRSLCFDAQAILDRLCHVDWELGLDPLPAQGTYLDFGSVLSDFDAYWRNIKHLPPLKPARLDGPQIGSALRTLRGLINLNMIWLFNHLERVTCMPFLTAAPTTSLPPQIACSWLLQAVATRRLTTVPAVLGQLIAQLLNLSSLLGDNLLQFLHLFLQRQDDQDQVFFIQLLKLIAIKLELRRHSQLSIYQVR